MLKLDNITITHFSGGRVLVDSLSCQIAAGDKIAIIGEEGTGKSTLLRAIAGQLDVDSFEMSGNVFQTGTTGYLPQEPPPLFLEQDTVSYLLKENPQDTIDLEKYELLVDVSRLLPVVGFDSKAFSETKKLKYYSGGEKVKLSLLKLLLTHPDNLLLDEPTNDLDLPTIEFLLDFIRKEKRPLIFVSHDEYLLRRAASGIIHLEQLKKRTEAHTVFAHVPYEIYRQERLKQRRKDLEIGLKQRSEYAQKMEKFRQIYSKVEYRQNQAVRNPAEARLLKKKIHVLKAEEKRLEKNRESFIELPEPDEFIDAFFAEDVSLPRSKIVFAIDNLILRTDRKVLAENICFELRGPEHVAIIGANGVGKSTFLRYLYSLTRTRTDLKFAYMPQEYSEVLNFDQPAFEFLQTEPTKAEEARVRRMMGALLFETDEMVAPIGRLSGGQKAKLLLLKLILDRPDVLLLDEPTRNLSPLNSPEVFRMIDQFKGAVIAVTHDREFLDSSFRKVYRLTPVGFQLERE